MNDDFLPSAQIAALKHRADVLRKLRRFFDDRDFFEVETPLLSHDIVIDRHLHPVGIPKNQITGVDSNSNEMLWLQTSPEFGMKRLVASGATAIYQIGKGVFGEAKRVRCTIPNSRCSNGIASEIISKQEWIY